MLPTCTARKEWTRTLSCLLRGQKLEKRCQGEESREKCEVPQVPSTLGCSVQHWEMDSAKGSNRRQDNEISDLLI